MHSRTTCAECGASRPAGITCEDLFHQMLFWENEDPNRGVVHHLMVLSYHLQHPSRLSQEGLEYSVQLLVDFLDGGVTPQQVRRERRLEVDSGKRHWRLRGKPGDQGAYERPIEWRMTAQDVVISGPETYTAQVQVWAYAILSDLQRKKK